jgi:predicted CopG family antitoxin
MVDSTTKTIRISNELYEGLAKQGKFGESFDDVLKRVLNGRSKKKLEGTWDVIR